MHISIYDYNDHILFGIFLSIVILIPALVILFDDGKIHSNAKK